jgi:hypothetical protein
MGCCNNIFDKTSDHYLWMLNTIEKNRAASVGEQPCSIDMDSKISVRDLITILQAPSGISLMS